MAYLMRLFDRERAQRKKRGVKSSIDSWTVRIIVRADGSWEPGLSIVGADSGERRVGFCCHILGKNEN